MKTLFHVAILACSLVIFSGSALGQIEPIKFSFEVDGKPVKKDFKVIFYAGSTEFETRTSKGHISIPLELRGTAKITGIRFISKKYNISFSPLLPKDLDANWTLGVDTKPFEQDNINTSISYDNIERLQYLRVRPRNGTYTWVLVDEVLGEQRTSK